MGICLCNKKNQEIYLNQINTNNENSNYTRNKSIHKNSLIKFLKIFNYKEVNKLGEKHCNIPNDPYERIRFIYDFYLKNTNLQYYVDKAPVKNKSSLNDLIDYLKSYQSKDILTKYFLVYLWITRNICYDTNSLNGSFVCNFIKF